MSRGATLDPGAPGAAAPAPVPAEGSGYRVRLAAFDGSLGELAHALRAGRLAPSSLDLLALVRDFLAYFDAHAGRDLDLATEALPAVAQVIELKLRLLLPRPPRATEEEAEELREEAVRAVETLERLEAAIVFLTARREQRRYLVPARTQPPPFERPRRPLDLPIRVLAAAAARYRLGGYFEIARDRLGVPEAMRRLLDRLARRGRSLWRALVPSDDWATRTVYFAALLELVRQGSVVAHQERPYGEIEVEEREAAPRGAVDPQG